VVELVELTDEDPPGELPPQLVRRRVSAAMPSVLMRAILWRSSVMLQILTLCSSFDVEIAQARKFRGSW